MRLKNGQKICTDVFQRRHTEGQQTHEKVLNVTHHWGNAHQTHVSSHLTPVRMASIKKARKNKCWPGCCEEGNPVGSKMVQLLWKTVWTLLEKLKTELPYDPAIPHVGIYVKKTKY